jgi:hypothetical protein
MFFNRLLKTSMKIYYFLIDIGKIFLILISVYLKKGNSKYKFLYIKTSISNYYSLRIL